VCDDAGTGWFERLARGALRQDRGARRDWLGSECSWPEAEAACRGAGGRLVRGDRDAFQRQLSGEQRSSR